MGECRCNNCAANEAVECKKSAQCGIQGGLSLSYSRTTRSYSSINNR